MASTGRPDGLPRRTLLRAIALAPAAAVTLAPRLDATEYASAAAVFAAVDDIEAEVDLRLRAIVEVVPSARTFVSSVLRDREAHRAARERLRKRFGLPSASPPRPRVDDPVDLAALRAAQERLVYAHAEGLPALGDRLGVDTMARNMVDLSRQLTVIDLWIEAEGNRG